MANVVPIVNRYPDPLRPPHEQAVIVAQLFCAQCQRNLENRDALVDLKTGHAFCESEHWREFFAKKGQIRR